MEEDPWGVFGSDTDDDNDEKDDDNDVLEEEGDNNDATTPPTSTTTTTSAASSSLTVLPLFRGVCQSVAARLTQVSVQANAQIRLDQRRVGIIRDSMRDDNKDDNDVKESDNDNCCENDSFSSCIMLMSLLKQTLVSRGFQTQEIKQAALLKSGGTGDDDDDDDDDVCCSLDAIVVVLRKQQRRGQQRLPGNTTSTGNTDGGGGGGDDSSSIHATLDKLYSRLVPGGNLFLLRDYNNQQQQEEEDHAIVSSLDSQIWRPVLVNENVTGVAAEGTISITSGNRGGLPTTMSRHHYTLTQLEKVACRIQHSRTLCPWLPMSSSSSGAVSREWHRVQQATVALSVHERNQQKLTAASLDRAVATLTAHGYCILPGLLQAQTCRKWGRAVLQDFHSAASILLQRDKVDLCNPGGGGGGSGGDDDNNAVFEPQAYRELSLREDLRADVRDGPALRAMRSSFSDNHNDTACFLNHADILDIAHRTMNPVTLDQDLADGNMGKYNFAQDNDDIDNNSNKNKKISVGRIGGIVSLPGAADQALHADTPHLFELSLPVVLPTHYINAFTPGAPSHDLVGQTALVHDSHQLHVAAQLLKEDANLKNKRRWWQHLVRPRLDPGDVLMFDCRILHFGLANIRSAQVERPILYINMTQHWFHDPKNWDNEQPIFEQDDYV